ncbi:MAG: trigger factor [bacterium]|nr:trigger factor [bacterium]
MEVTVDKSSSSLAKISFVVPGEELEREVSNGLRQASQSVRMKGFRPGKVPARVLEKRFGEQVRNDVREHFLRKAYQEAVQEHELRPMTHPRVTPEDIAEAEDGGLRCNFELPLRPTVELPDYKGLAIDSELEPVMDQHIDNAIDEIKRSQSTPEPAEDGIGEEGMVVCEVKFRHGEEEVFSREGLRLNRQTPPPGVEPEAFAEKLLGAKEGDEIEFTMTLPDTLENEEARGKEGTCVVVVNEAYDLIEPTEERIFELLEVEDQDSLKTKVRERLEEASQERERGRLEGALLDQLIAATDIELPEPLLEDQTRNRLAQLAQRMESQDVPKEEIEKQLEEQKATAREEAEKGLRALLIVEAIGEKEELLVTNEEMEAELASIAERNEATVDEVREYYGKNNLGQQMAIEILERKVRGFLRDSAEVRIPG